MSVNQRLSMAAIGLAQLGFVAADGLASVLPVQSGLQLWLDSSDINGNGSAYVSGTVGAWVDKAGANNNATGANAPAYVSSDAAFNSRPVVSFDGVNDVLTGSGFSLNGMTAFVVGRINTGTGANAGVFTLNDGSTLDYLSGDTAIVWSSGFTSGTPSGADARWRGNAFGSATGNATGTSISNISTPLGSAYVYDFRVENNDATSVRGTVRIGGQIATSLQYGGGPNTDANTVMSAATANNPTQYVLGGRLVPNAGAPFAKTDVAEVILFDRALNGAERLIVENHLAAKYSPDSGSKLAVNDFYAGDNVGNGNYDYAAVGIGNKTTTGDSGKLATSADGGGLVLAEHNSSLNADNEFLLAGRANLNPNSWTTVSAGVANYRWSRDWFVDKTTSDSLDATLTFDTITGDNLTLPFPLIGYELLYRSSLAGPWTDLGLTATVSGNQISFAVLNANLQDGFYTLGASLLVPEPGALGLALAGSSAALLRRWRA